jgi:hypothetical protein
MGPPVGRVRLAGDLAFAEIARVTRQSASCMADYVCAHSPYIGRSYAAKAGSFFNLNLQGSVASRSGK